MSAYMHFVCYLSEGRWEIYIGLQKNKLLERKEKKTREEFPYCEQKLFSGTLWQVDNISTFYMLGFIFHL
jgi:hypothetical protein